MNSPDRPPRRSINAWLLLAVISALALTGCAAVLVGGAAAGTAAVIHDRRDYTDILKDQEIEIRAAQALGSDSSVSDSSRISVTSYNRKVLLTGQAQSAEVAARATDLVRRIPKVELVIDEVTIGPNISLTQESQDAWLTSQAKLAMAKVDSPDFDPTRVKVVTEDGVVFLMGLVSSAEGDAAAEQVRYVPGVKRVVKLFEYRESQS